MAKKATVKISGITEAKNSALKFLNETAKDKSFLDSIGQLTADQIRNRTRAGLDEYKQDDITTYTKDRRAALIKSGNAFDSKIVKPNKSNLSMSGQLLDAIKFRVNNSISEVTIFLSQKREAYKGRFKDKLENKKNNIEIKNDLEDQGRKFFFISDKLTALLESKIASELRRKLALYNKIKRSLKL
jgi:hypothetical protein